MRRKDFFALFCIAFSCSCVKAADPYEGYDSNNSGYNRQRVYNLDFNYATPLSASMKYSNGNVIADNTGMQSFDILSNGDIIMGGCDSKGKLYFQRISPGKSSASVMTVDAGSHCTNMSVEESGGSAYVWFCNMGTAAGNYFNEQIVSRVKFQSLNAISGKDCTDNYYVGETGGSSLLVSTDTENDLLAIIVGLKARIYKLSAAKEAVVVEKNITGVTMKVHDLTTIQPYASFTIDSERPIQGIDRDGDTRPMQGFCVYKDKLYWLAGDGTNPDAAVSEINFNGNVVLSCQELSIDDDTQALIDMGLSQTGYFEPEGIKVRKGKLYIGFIWNLKGVSPWTWRSSILKFN